MDHHCCLWIFYLTWRQHLYTCILQTSICKPKHMHLLILLCFRPNDWLMALNWTKTAALTLGLGLGIWCNVCQLQADFRLEKQMGCLQGTLRIILVYLAFVFSVLYSDCGLKCRGDTRERKRWCPWALSGKFVTVKSGSATFYIIMLMFAQWREQETKDRLGRCSRLLNNNIIVKGSYTLCVLYIALTWSSSPPPSSSYLSMLSLTSSSGSMRSCLAWRSLSRRFIHTTNSSTRTDRQEERERGRCITKHNNLHIFIHE